MFDNEKRLSRQKFVIKTDGTIIVDWVNPDFSDIIIDTILSKEERKKMLSTTIGEEPKIWCG
jgi:hypothetical protein